MTGLDGLAADERFATNALRVARRDQLNAHLIPRFRERNSDTWLAEFRAADVLVAPVHEIDQVFADPQVQHNGVVVTLDDPQRGTLPSIRPGFRLESAPDIPLRPPRVLGADTEAVLAELGYAAAQIDALRRQQIV